MTTRKGTRADPQPVLVLVDTECAFCLWAAGVLLSWDRRGRLATASIRRHRPGLLSGVPQARVLSSWHVLTPTGQLVSAGDALVAVLRVLPGLAVLGYLLGRWPRGAEVGYRFVATRRAVLARLLPQAWKDQGRRRVEERLWSGDASASAPAAGARTSVDALL